MIIYLAGPDVFHPQWLNLGILKKEVCHHHGFDAIFPTDYMPEDIWTKDPLTQARMIRQACIDGMNNADMILANMSPFRGAGMDGGTAFEMGYMDALGKPVYAYTHGKATYIERVLENNHLPYHTYQHDGKHYSHSLNKGKAEEGVIYLDDSGLVIENFNDIDNCMMTQTVYQYMDKIPCADSTDFYDLSGFIKAIKIIKSKNN